MGSSLLYARVQHDDRGFEHDRLLSLPGNFPRRGLRRRGLGGCK